MQIDPESPNFVVGLLAGLVLGMVALWSFINPVVGRVVARVLGVVALGFGVVWLTTAIVDIARKEPNPHYYSPLGQGGSAVALGWGVGGLVVGILIIVFSFLRVWPKEQKGPSAPEDARVK
jgi:amino acid transporter